MYPQEDKFQLNVVVSAVIWLVGATRVTVPGAPLTHTLNVRDALALVRFPVYAVTYQVKVVVFPAAQDGRVTSLEVLVETS